MSQLLRIWLHLVDFDKTKSSDPVFCLFYATRTILSRCVHKESY